MEYLVEKKVPFSVHSESSGATLHQGQNFYFKNGVNNKNNSQQYNQVYQDQSLFEKNSTQSTSMFAPPGLSSECERLLSAIGESHPPLEPLEVLTNNNNNNNNNYNKHEEMFQWPSDMYASSMDKVNSLYIPDTRFSKIPQSNETSFSSFPPIFNSDSMWGVSGTLISDNKEFNSLQPPIISEGNNIMQSQSVNPLGGFNNNSLHLPIVAPPSIVKSQKNLMVDNVQKLFLSLTEGTDSGVSCGTTRETNMNSPSLQKNMVNFMMSQLIDDDDNDDNNNSNNNGVTCNSRNSPIRLQQKIETTKEIHNIALSTPVNRINKNISNSYRIAPPLAVGCSPLLSPRGGLSDGGGNTSGEFKQDCYFDTSPVYLAGDNSGSGSISGSTGSQQNITREIHHTRRVNNNKSLNTSPASVVNNVEMSFLHRNSPQALNVKTMINKSKYGRLISTPEWPPYTKKEAIILLKKLQATELLNHLNIISFSRQDSKGVEKLFNSWISKGIPPQDLVFGAYYWYAMKIYGEEMCLKHNGRGRAMGHGWGCDYASKGPHFKCRYHHACLFCKADDHGWFDEDCCPRYIKLQQEMIKLGLTDSAGKVLLDAFECDK